MKAVGSGQWQLAVAVAVGGGQWAVDEFNFVQYIFNL